MNGVRIQQTDNIKYFGVIIDKKLLCTLQIGSLCRQTDNSSLFCMANEKTRRSSKSADHGSVIICLLSCNSSDTQMTDATLEN